MKKVLLEWAFTLALAALYSAWRYREDLRGIVGTLDDELVEQLQYRKAIEATLRSIRGLPETDA
jgi:hypothetical protein